MPTTSTEPSTESHDPRRPDRGGRWLGLVALLAPVVVAALVLQHPADPVDAMELVDRAGLWIWLHVGLLGALALLAGCVWWLVEPLQSTAARLARVLLPLALVLYASFDTLVGIGTGLLVQHASELDLGPDDPAQLLIAAWWDVPPVVAVISAAAQAAWVAVLGAVTIAQVTARAPRSVVWSLAVTTVTFPLLHFRPVGVVSMAALLVAVMLSRRIEPTDGTAASVAASTTSWS